MKIHAIVLIAVFAFVSIGVDAAALPATGAQVVTETKTKTKYVAHKTKTNTKYVAHKTKTKTKYVAHKTKRGTKSVYRTTAAKTRPARHKTWHTGRKVVSRTKKIIS